MKPLDTTPIYDDNSIPMFRRVYYDQGGGYWDGFKSRAAAATYWRMLARKKISAWLPSGLDGWLPNRQFFSQPEPLDMVSRLDACEKQYDAQFEPTLSGVWSQLVA